MMKIDIFPKHLDIIIKSIFTYSHLIDEQKQTLEITKQLIIPNINEYNTKIFIKNNKFLNFCNILINDIPLLYQFMNKILAGNNSKQNYYINHLISEHLLSKKYLIMQQYDLINYFGILLLDNSVQISIALNFITLYINLNNSKNPINILREIYRILLILLEKCENDKQLIINYDRTLVRFYPTLPEDERYLILNSFVELCKGNNTNPYVLFYKDNNIFKKYIFYVIIIQVKVYIVSFPENIQIVY